MDEKLKHIDEYFKKKLDSFERDTSVNLWRKLSWLLLLKKYGIWIGTGAVLSAILLSYLLITPQVGNKSSLAPPERNANIVRPTSSIDSQNLILEINGITDIEDKKIEAKTLVSKETIDQSGIKLEPEDSKEIRINKSIQGSNPKDKQLISNPTSKPDKKIKGTSLSSEDNPSSISFLALLSIDQFSLKSIPSKSIKANAINNSYSLPAFPEEEEKNLKPTRSSKFAIDLFINPSYVTQSLSASDDLNEHIQYREDSEEPMFTTGFGAEIKYSIKNFFLQSGLNYSEYGQQYQYNSETNNYTGGIAIDTTWIWIIDPPFIEPYPIAFDSVLIAIIEPVNSSLSGKSTYQYLEIPLLFGYQHSFSKLNMEISTGISYGFYLSAKGELPDKSNSSFLDLSEQSDIIENNINYLLYLGLEYKLNNKWGLLIKPNYKHNLNSTFKSDYPVKQKFSTFGVAFGVRINL